tara:strand:+ start:6447 stop:7295 length:849 start_codon:yes stop_codon:yes gene_type:complete
MIKVAGYGRMSTDKQKMSPKVQTSKINGWFEQQKLLGRWEGGAKFVGMYVDEAVSAKVDMLHREFGQHLLAVLDPGDLVVVASVSRAFRSVVDTWNTMSIFKEAGIDMVFMDAQMDTSTPSGKMMLTFVSAFAEFERDMISARTKDALAYKREQGEPICSAPVGWSITKSGKRKVFSKNKDERIIADAARNLFREGRSRLDVARTMDRHLKSHGLPQRSAPWFVTAAAASSLHFPRQSGKFIGGVLGYNIDTMSFVRRDDHDDIRAELRLQLIQDGFNGSKI